MVCVVLIVRKIIKPWLFALVPSRLCSIFYGWIDCIRNFLGIWRISVTGRSGHVCSGPGRLRNTRATPNPSHADDIIIDLSNTHRHNVLYNKVARLVIRHFYHLPSYWQIIKSDNFRVVILGWNWRVTMYCRQWSDNLPVVNLRCSQTIHCVIS